MSDPRKSSLRPLAVTPEVVNIRLKRVLGNLAIAFLAIGAAYVAHAIDLSGWTSGMFLGLAFLTLLVSIDFYVARTMKG